MSYQNTHHSICRLCCISLLVLAVLFTLPGCKTISPESDSSLEIEEQRLYELRNLSGEQCMALLAQLGFKEFPNISDGNSILVNSSPELLNKVDQIIELVDVDIEYCIENLGPASAVRNLPSNSQLASFIGNINIGTFSEPPGMDENSLAIIDILGDYVFAILPASYNEQLLSLLSEPESISEPISIASFAQPAEPVISAENTNQENIAESQIAIVKDTNTESAEAQKTQTSPRSDSTRVYAISEMGSDEDSQQEEQVVSMIPEEPVDTGIPETVRIIFKPATDISQEQQDSVAAEIQEPENGDNILDMTLPETLTLVQLLDMAGEHLDLDYVYNPDTVGNPTVSLKLHGSLEGQMRVKDLYSLLETVLKFNNLAMIRRENNLVTIVKSENILDADPQFIDDQGKNLEVGDTVVTRIFELKYVDVASVSKLLENMKLGIAVTPLEDIQMLFVTCYTYRIDRIEQLVNMIDRPGQVRECRFRRLQFVTAKSLTDKIKTLAKELQGITVTTAQATEKPVQEPIKILTATTSATSTSDNISVESRTMLPVYLDSDERTNRILMIGYENELNLIEELIDVLDIVPADLRTPKTYTIKHLKAEQALKKLQQMEIIKTSQTNAAQTDTASGDNVLTEDPLVTILESTNQLLIKATRGQHVRINEYLSYIDISPEDLRTLEIYSIRYVDAGIVNKKLQELELISEGTPASVISPDSNNMSITQDATEVSPEGPVSLDVASPQVVVNESSNELFIKATPEQHSRIAGIIERLDKKVAEEELSYEIYPLENSSPRHMAQMLELLIHETFEGSDDKIVREKKNTETKISIVPDPNTFSLIIYTSQKNHLWIEDLISRLDKRRPMVLIDVTLVEVTRTDTFEYDLNVVANAQDYVLGNVGLSPLQTSTSGSLLEAGYNLLDQNGNPTGQTKIFYSDDKVQALLTSMRRKNYGRVLAQPKILVDDGRIGEISTIDETTYLRETVQVPDQGGAITSRDYEIKEAMLQLAITPHITEGNLLRLDVLLRREDFGTRPSEGAPPDKTTSSVNTTVVVPDNYTMILGGLVKLNQSKGGSKVPILGDLPLIGFLFRSVDKSDVEKKLYVFLKANIVRPSDQLEYGDLQNISREHREAFEKSESEFQEYENIPGTKPIPMQPEKVLDNYK